MSILEFKVSILIHWLVKNFGIFWYVLLCNVYITWAKQFKLWKAPTVVMVVGVLTCYALLHSVRIKSCTDEYAAILIQEFMLYEFEVDHDAAEATQNYLLCDRWMSCWSQYSKQI